MCSSDPTPPLQEVNAAASAPPADPDEVAVVNVAAAAVAQPGVAAADEAGADEDPLARFAIAAARQQAAERGEEEAEGVDMAFITRALAESRRMRGAAAKDQKKRADNMASMVARHGEQSAAYVQAAMAEHAAEVLTPQAQALVASAEAQAEEEAAAAPMNIA